jgi:2-polyprenyl-6-methoxyphenol hydroxylase-like FAD-dependent oxidoreductase
MPIHAPVLVVGGSLNGLTMAVLLAELGVEVVVVERRPATTVQYKFSGISPRSMEIYRQAGLEDAIRRHATGDQKAGEIARARNLSDPDVQFMGKAWSAEGGLSAVTAATCDQDRLEPLLRAQAERFGASIRFHTEMLSFQQDEDCVRVRVCDRNTGIEEEIVAQYLIAADGSASPVREALGVAREGAGVLQNWMNLVFDAGLEPVMQGRRITSCFVTDVNGAIVPRADRWLLGVQYEPENGERPEDFDQDRVATLVRRAVGRDDVAVKLFDARDWQVSAFIADRFRVGRVFLIGDAAHTMPPTGGFGGNTGIQDAHNLAWKLTMVLRGQAGAALLDTYDVERRHVAQRTLAQALARLASWFANLGRPLPASEPVVDDINVILGLVYPSGAFTTDGEPSDGNFEDVRNPSGRPGTRAPHIAIERAGVTGGIHDLFGRRFVLLSRDSEWRAAAQAIGRRSAFPISGFQIGIGARAMHDGADMIDVDERFSRLYGVGEAGAVLVRPDGIIAWRTSERATGPDDALAAAIGTICQKPHGSPKSLTN